VIIGFSNIWLAEIAISLSQLAGLSAGDGFREKGSRNSAQNLRRGIAAERRGRPPVAFSWDVAFSCPMLAMAIATSKKNGMWMGGMPPLGYDAVVGLGTLATKLSQKGLDFGRNQSVTVEERSGSDRPGSCPAGYTPAAGFRW
jgi:hypothetical protein